MLLLAALAGHIRAKRKALGKGLDSLLPRVAPPAEAAPKPAAVEVPTGRPMEIPVGNIDRNPYQTRTHFDEKLLGELPKTPYKQGIQQTLASIS